MVGMVIILAIILCYSSCMALLFRKSIEYCIPISILIIIIILYFFGLIEVLQGSIIALYVLAAAGLAITVIYAVKDVKGTFGKLFTPGTVIYLLAFALFCWAQIGRQLSSWDEFSHWGLTVKNIYLHNSLDVTSESTTMFKDYPPAISLFQYLLMKIAGRFNEADMFRAMNILYFSLMMPLFTDIRWKNWARPLLLVGIVLLIPLMFWQTFYTALYVDAFMGVLFGYILYSHFTRKMDYLGICNTALALAVLSLIKSSGLWLAVMCVTIIIVAEGIGKLRFTEYIANGRASTNILMLTLPILVPAAVIVSWKILCITAGINTTWKATQDAASYATIVEQNFMAAFTSTVISDRFVKVSTAIWLALLAVPAILIWRKEKDEAKRKVFKTVMIITYIGAFVYLGSLLLLYIHSFSEYEAVRLASYPRYVLAYLLGMTVFIIPFLLDCMTSNKRLAAVFIVIFLLSNPTPIYNMALFQSQDVALAATTRASYAQLTDIQKVVGTGRVYFISIADNGFDYYVSRYVATPARMLGKWSIGDSPYFEGDIWTWIISPDDWRKRLKGNYEYVYVFKTNEEFNTKYGKAFANGVMERTLYRVLDDKDTVRMEPVK